MRCHRLGFHGATYSRILVKAELWKALTSFIKCFPTSWLVSRAMQGHCFYPYVALDQRVNPFICVTPKWRPSDTQVSPKWNPYDSQCSHCGSTTFICVVVLCEQNRNNNIGFACYSTPYASPLQWLVSKLQQQQKTTVTVFLVREIYRKTSILTNCQPQRQDWPRLEKKTMKMMNTTLLLYSTDPERLRQSQCWCKQVV